MIRFTRLCRFLVLPLVALFLSATTLPGLATANMIATDEVVANEVSAADREAVRAFLQREDVRTEIEAWGVDPAEAQVRIDAMSDAEIAQIAGILADDPAGQAVGAIVGAAILIFVILLITDIAGATDVFPFVRASN